MENLEMFETNKLMILGLNDDNHDPCFRCEDGTFFSSYKELVEFLCKPHDCEVEVRMFAIVDDIPLTCGLADYNQEQIDDMFYFLEDCAPLPDGMIFDLVFALFWHAANRRYW